MKYFLFIFCTCFIFSVQLMSQTIDITLTQYPNKDLTVTLYCGTGRDTIFHAPLDDKGNARIVIPQTHTGYRGMATLKTGDRTWYDFIIAGENFSLMCNEKYPYGDNVRYIGSLENESLEKWYFEQLTLHKKTGALTQVLNLYKPDESLYFPLEKEKEQLEKELQKLNVMLTESKLYAADFIKMRNTLDYRIANLILSSNEDKAGVRNFVRDNLDINSLYTSGMWFDTLNGLLVLYDKEAPYHDDFITDMSILLDRAADDRIYISLAENLFTICETMGWNEQAEQLAAYLINGRRINQPTGKLKVLFTLFKLEKGSKAPALSQGKLPAKNTILAFYETGCGNCNIQMSKLADNYAQIKDKGYEIISISADSDKTVFENSSKKFPWESKYCDFKGFDGKDFQNYGVLGTPTFYVIDGKGIITGRYARAEDMDFIK